MRTKFILIFLMVSFGVGLCILPKETKTKDRTNFAFDFKSPSTFNEIESTLKAKDFKHYISNINELSAEDKRPKFSFFTLTVINFSHGDQSGELKLKFFNDELYQMLFKPNNIKKFIDLFYDLNSKKLQLGECFDYSLHTEVCFRYDYVSFTNKIIERRVKEWVMKWS